MSTSLLRMGQQEMVMLIIPNHEPLTMIHWRVKKRETAKTCYAKQQRREKKGQCRKLNLV